MDENPNQQLFWSEGGSFLTEAPYTEPDGQDQDPIVLKTTEPLDLTQIHCKSNRAAVEEFNHIQSQHPWTVKSDSGDSQSVYTIYDKWQNVLREEAPKPSFNVTGNSFNITGNCVSNTSTILQGRTKAVLGKVVVFYVSETVMSVAKAKEIYQEFTDRLPANVMVLWLRTSGESRLEVLEL